MFPCEIIHENISYKILDEKVDLSDFLCDESDHSGVNEFIHCEALDYQKDNLGVTYIFYYGDKIIAFVTISMNGIDYNQAPDKEKIDYFEAKHPPVLYIGQLGVHNEARNRGVGSSILDFCSGIGAILSKIIGVRYVALQCDKRVANFYKKNRFDTVSDSDKDIWFMVRRLEKVDIKARDVLKALKL
ncbi:MAG: GNAT family N-acetyltransferase [Atribacterota bacterium]